MAKCKGAALEIEYKRGEQNEPKTKTQSNC